MEKGKCKELKEGVTEADIFYGNEYNGFGKVFKLGADAVKDRVIGECTNNSLVDALFITVSIPAILAGPPSGASTYETNGYLLLWGTAFVLQLLSLTLSITIATMLNKCGSPEAIISFVKVLQKEVTLTSPSVTWGGIAYVVAFIQWIITAIAVCFTAFIIYPNSRPVLYFIYAFAGLALVVQFVCVAQLEAASKVDMPHGVAPE